ncbi:hypothetical protein GCM10022381_29120 [Leifsonia kafniensis]|uniref:Uncharacterized protein n=1 Tax=Leifsonia kafniensis TaxID=475957 RepID=A0ABP7KQY6_9MICO
MPRDGIREFRQRRSRRLAANEGVADHHKLIEREGGRQLSPNVDGGCDGETVNVRHPFESRRDEMAAHTPPFPAQSPRTRADVNVGLLEQAPWHREAVEERSRDVAEELPLRHPYRVLVSASA